MRFSVIAPIVIINQSKLFIFLFIKLI